MPIARSKLTAQGQVSVPAEDDDGAIVVRKAGRYSSDDLHRALFPRGAPRRQAIAPLEEGVRRYARKI